MANHLNVPTTGTVGPGVNGVVTAVGADIPAELAAYKPYGGTPRTGSVLTAVVHYNNVFSSSLTTPFVKYWFQAVGYDPASKSTTLLTGVCICANPHVSTTGIIYVLSSENMQPNPAAAAGFVFKYARFNSQGNSDFQIGEDDANGDPVVSVIANNGNIGVQLLPNYTYDTAGDIGGVVATFDINTAAETGQLPVFGP